MANYKDYHAADPNLRVKCLHKGCENTVVPPRKYCSRQCVANSQKTRPMADSRVRLRTVKGGNR
jgi:hypothetical protein